MNPDTTAQLRQKLDKWLWNLVAEVRNPTMGELIVEGENDLAYTKDHIMQAIADYISQLELPEKPGLHVVAEMEDFKKATEGLHPMSNDYQEIQRTHVFSMGVKAGRASAIDDTASTLQKAVESLRK